MKLSDNDTLKSLKEKLHSQNEKEWNDRKVDYNDNIEQQFYNRFRMNGVSDPSK